MGMLAILPVLAVLVTPPASGAPRAPVDRGIDDAAVAAEITASVLGRADHVLAVHELAGGIAFDLLERGHRWQLTVALDDDGRVVDTALALVGHADERTLGQVARHPRRVTMTAVEQIDQGPAATIVLRGGGRTRTLPVTDDA